MVKKTRKYWCTFSLHGITYEPKYSQSFFRILFTYLTCLCRQLSFQTEICGESFHPRRKKGHIYISVVVRVWAVLARAHPLFGENRVKHMARPTHFQNPSYGPEMFDTLGDQRRVTTCKPCWTVGGLSLHSVLSMTTGGDCDLHSAPVSYRERGAWPSFRGFLGFGWPGPPSFAQWCVFSRLRLISKTKMPAESWHIFDYRNIKETCFFLPVLIENWP